MRFFFEAHFLYLIKKIFCDISITSYFCKKKELRVFFSIFLSFIILLTTFSNAIVFFVFKTNQEQIAKTMCELKKVKNNTCNGHCVLKKELKKLEDTERKIENSIKEKAELVFVLFQLNINTLSTFLNIRKKEIFFHNGKTKIVVLPFFHPPTL